MYDIFGRKTAVFRNNFEANVKQTFALLQCGIFYTENAFSLS